MLGFSKKRTEFSSSEYDSILKKISELKSDFEEIKATVESLKTNQNSLRGLINRKFGGEKQENPEDQLGKPLNSGFPF